VRAGIATVRVLVAGGVVAASVQVFVKTPAAAGVAPVFPQATRSGLRTSGQRRGRGSLATSPAATSAAAAEVGGDRPPRERGLYVWRDEPAAVADPELAVAVAVHGALGPQGEPVVVFLQQCTVE